MNLEEEAKRNFNSGYNCAESVLLALCQQPGIARPSAGSFVPRIATGFGGGIARNGNICGALAGGVMAISLVLGRDRSEESRDPCYLAVDQFYNEFVKEFGTCRCRELTGVDLKTEEGRAEHEKRIHDQKCNSIVAWAAKKTCAIIREER